MSNNISNEEKDILYISQNEKGMPSRTKISRMRVLNYIQTHSGQNIYQISRGLGINYNSAHSIVKLFEVAGLVEITSEKTKDNRKTKVVRIK